MITYEDIRKANEIIKTTPIKGKDYAEVNQRIKAFRMLYPEGYITTEMISNENGVCVFKATVGTETGAILGTGTAYEKEGSSFINTTSYIENCETSAVGRALGMIGLGIDTSIASAEEVQNAQLNQGDNKIQERKASPKQISVLQGVYKGDDLKKLLKSNGIEKLEDMPLSKASELIGKLNKIANKNNVDNYNWKNESVNG